MERNFSRVMNSSMTKKNWKWTLKYRRWQVHYPASCKAEPRRERERERERPYHMIKVINNLWFNSKLGVVTNKFQKMECHNRLHKSNLNSINETGITKSIVLFFITSLEEDYVGHGKLLRIGTMSKTLVQETKKKCGNHIETLSHWNWKTHKISWPKKEERIEAWVLKTWKTAPLYTIPVPPFESFSKTKNYQDSTNLFRVLKRSSFKLQGNMATPMLCLEKKIHGNILVRAS
jgi:hypothetical protein